MNGTKGISVLCGVENKKIYGQIKYRLLLLMVAVVSIIGAFSGTLPGALHFTMENYPYTILSMISYVFAPLAIFMLASDLFSGEIEQGQIKVILTRPVARYKVLFAKVLSILGYVGTMLLTGLTVSSVTSIITSGFTSFSIITVILAYLTNLFPLIAITGIAVLVGVHAKESTSCFGLCLIAYIGCMVLGLVFSSLSPLLFTSYMGIGSMVIGSAIPFGSLFTGIFILAGYALVFFSASSLRFENREF